MKEDAYRIVLADDHAVLRSGVKALLEAEPDMSVVGEAATGEEAVALVLKLKPDVLLLDVQMPKMSGVEVLRALQRAGLSTRTLALSAYDDPQYVEGLLKLGAFGYITKEKPPAVIVEAVRAVGCGEARWFVRPGQHVAGADLTERERDVLKRLARGLSNEAIAAELHLSEHTVRNHLAAVYAKLDVGSAREAIAWAWEHGIAPG